ncbi:DNA-3-methyladenine glycosylase family protein [Oerskovia jenensis]|uniref:DNA-3-methyladenine glycosylase II n=1 Tax=Oerskovia jenensis TaxID=162169 RepID=A0ABS2LB20_9CELL|nr:DNA-3-methyladenine glycosylase 2 family protein [Oerskovia jenensis]MBM7477547.1 AraC family transcriptional regulator of adaptative response / DNA-3-methyladenine glycosylase II [Oerskovia jenensis]
MTLPDGAATLPGAGAPEAVAWTRRVAVAQPFDAASALATLVAHAVPGVDRVDRSDAAHGEVTRLVETRSGTAAVTVRLTPEEIEVRGSGPDADEVCAVVARWFDADADLATVHTVLGADPVLAPLLAARPGLRVVGHPSGFEAAVTTVLGQQVSLAACRTFAGRLAAAYGRDADVAGSDGLRLFPDPDTLAGAQAAELQSAVGITGARTRTLLALATACADGLTLGPGTAGDPATLADTRARLLALPGIGPWTVDYLSVKVLGDRDGFVPGDLVLRKALGGIDARAAARASEVWSPVRAYALFHLWTHTAY